RDALVGSVLVGLVCPLVGAYFVLRRMIFLGVALPQLSAAGIAASFVFFQLVMGPHQHGQVSERALAMGGAFLFTLGGLLVLAAFERQGRETVEARIGVTYAVAFGKRVGLWDGLLYLLIGVTISLGVMTAGPLVTFGFLVVPPLTARLLTHRMLSFSLVAAVLGGVCAFGGFYAAYRIDLPLGPAEVALASLLLAVVGAGAAVVRAAGRPA